MGGKNYAEGIFFGIIFVRLILYLWGKKIIVGKNVANVKCGVYTAEGRGILSHIFLPSFFVGRLRCTEDFWLASELFIICQV